jgi:hypothetical protein
MVYGQTLMATSAPPPPESPFARFSALVKRELGADDVRILDAAAVPSGATNVLFASLEGGRHVAVTFATTPESPPALLRRLEILVRTFAQALEEEPNTAAASHRTARQPVSLSLHDELRALAQRARAVDAIVLDAHSPVVWGSALSRGPRTDTPDEEVVPALERLEESRRELLRVINEMSPDSPGGTQDVEPLVPVPAPSAEMLVELEDEQEPPATSQRAVREVRDLPELPALRKGRPIVHVVREDDFGYVARSFAGIYLVVLVFEAPFDELRAERAMTEALHKIERLVLALPPLDPGPAPSANVIAFRRRRR